jgi:hypothetical protein
MWKDEERIESVFAEDVLSGTALQAKGFSTMISTGLWISA